MTEKDLKEIMEGQPPDLSSYVTWQQFKRYFVAGGIAVGIVIALLIVGITALGVIAYNQADTSFKDHQDSISRNEEAIDRLKVIERRLGIKLRKQGQATGKQQKSKSKHQHATTGRGTHAPTVQTPTAIPTQPAAPSRPGRSRPNRRGRSPSRPRKPRPTTQRPTPTPAQPTPPEQPHPAVNIDVGPVRVCSVFVGLNCH